MMMRILAGALFALLLALQVRLWLSEDGYGEIVRLEEQVRSQTLENQRLKERNSQLDAEVEDLKGGFAALEERARSDLGMVGRDESFYLFGTVEAEPAD